MSSAPRVHSLHEGSHSVWTLHGFRQMYNDTYPDGVTALNPVLCLFISPQLPAATDFFIVSTDFYHHVHEEHWPVLSCWIASIIFGIRAVWTVCIKYMGEGFLHPPLSAGVV